MAIHSNTKAPKEINLMMVPLLQAAINGHIMQLIIKRRLKIFHILLLPSIFPTFSYPCTKPPTAPAIVPTPISQGAEAASAAIGGEMQCLLRGQLQSQKCHPLQLTRSQIHSNRKIIKQASFLIK